MIVVNFHEDLKIICVGEQVAFVLRSFAVVSTATFPLKLTVFNGVECFFIHSTFNFFQTLKIEAQKSFIFVGDKLHDRICVAKHVTVAKKAIQLGHKLYGGDLVTRNSHASPFLTKC